MCTYYGGHVSIDPTINSRTLVNPYLIVLNGFYSSIIFNIIVKVVQRVRHGGYLNGLLILFVPYLVSCLVKTLNNSNLQ